MTNSPEERALRCVRCNDNRAGFCGECMEKQSDARVQAATAASEKRVEELERELAKELKYSGPLLLAHAAVFRALAGIVGDIPIGEIPDTIRKQADERVAAERAKLWECPDCGFMFHRDHENVDGSGHSCPECESKTKVAAEREAFDELPCYYDWYNDDHGKEPPTCWPLHGDDVCPRCAAIRQRGEG